MRRLPLPGLLTLVLAACNTEGPTAAAPRVETSAALVQATPLNGGCELLIQPAEPIGPGVIRQIDVGDCIVAHLGKSRMVSDKIINFAAGTQITQISLTAANGDVLTASGSGTNRLVAPGRVAFIAHMTFTGGTGRFADASGEMTASGEADTAAGRSQVTLKGSLRY